MADNDKPGEGESKRDDGSVEVKLHHPIRALDETKESLVFREPTANDVYKIGDPTKIMYDEKGNGYIDIKDDVMMEMMSELSKVPLGSIRSMKIPDYKNCKYAVANFFMLRPPPSSS